MEGGCGAGRRHPRHGAARPQGRSAAPAQQARHPARGPHRERPGVSGAYCQQTMSPEGFSGSVFCLIHDVLLLLMVVWAVLSNNQAGATLAPLGRIFYGQKTKWPPRPSAWRIKSS